ncbi:MAG: tungsten formylmethanofuran dehydrogenase [Deltaproteobacteria bacterium]|nr:tungsten formylmethanofuran dehydrogenase [Deltaproteobacteria bacterium]
MNRVQIDRERCKACGLCIAVCNKHLLAFGGALNSHGYQPVELHDAPTCTACALCGVVCPEAGVQVYKAAKPKPAAAGDTP